jgi:hypothetical protein
MTPNEQLLSQWLEASGREIQSLRREILELEYANAELRVERDAADRLFEAACVLLRVAAGGRS